MPTEVLSAAFGMPKPTAGATQREIVALANGGQAVIVVTGVEAGEPATMTQDGARSAPAAARGSSGARRAHGLRGQRSRARPTSESPSEILEPAVRSGAYRAQVGSGRVSALSSGKDMPTMLKPEST